MSITITELHGFGTDPVESLVFGVTLGGKAGWAAKVTMADGTVQRVSRLHSEDRWVVDGEWAAGRSFPRFWNGEASRCTALLAATPEVEAALAESIAQEPAPSAVLVCKNRAAWA